MARMKYIKNILIGCLVLHELEVEPARGQAPVRLERLERVGGSGEGVHQHEGEVDAVQSSGCGSTRMRGGRLKIPPTSAWLRGLLEW